MSEGGDISHFSLSDSLSILYLLISYQFCAEKNVTRSRNVVVENYRETRFYENSNQRRKTSICDRGGRVLSKIGASNELELIRNSGNFDDPFLSINHNRCRRFFDELDTAVFFFSGFMQKFSVIRFVLYVKIRIKYRA